MKDTGSHMRRWGWALLLVTRVLAADSPLDSILGAYFRDHSITSPAPVSDAVFARRAYLDLWGVVPDPEQLKSFVDDGRPGKRERLIDNLLANRKNYAERWISFWNAASDAGAATPA